MFTIGDLVLFALVVLTFIVFRQVDAKNRSLEKVKRLGDKLMADMIAISEERSVQLRDMAIEVDVHQQASKMAMERMQAAEDGLNARSALIEEMQTRIDAYDTALRELIGMTQKAEENISRLRDESAYIDKVGRRIRQAAGQLQQLQDKIPQMLSDFEQSNRGSLSSMGEQVIQQAETKIANLEGQLEMSNRSAVESIQRMRSEIDDVQEDLSRRADAYRRAFEDIERDYNNRLEEVASRGIVLETETLRRLTEHIHTQVDERKTELAAVLENTRQKIQEEADVLNSRVDGLRNGMDGWEDELAERNKAVQAAYEKRIADQGAVLDANVIQLEKQILQVRQAMLEDLQGVQEHAATRVGDVQQDVRGMIELTRSELEREINLARQEINSWQMDVQNTNTEVESELRRSFNDSKSRLENELVSLVNHIDGVKNDLDRQIEDSRHENESSIDEFQATVAGRVEGLEGSIYQLEQNLAEKLVAAQERGKTLADTLLMRINQDVDTRTDSMREAITQRLEQVNASVQASHDQIDESFTELRGRVDGWIDTSRSYMARLDEQVRTLNDESRSANLEHKATIESHIEETQSRLSAYEQGLSTRIAELEAFISRAEDMVQDKFARLHDHASELSEQTGKGLDEQYETGRIELLDQCSRRFEDLRTELDAGFHGVENLIAGVRQQVQEWSGRVDSQVNDFEGKTRLREDQAVKIFEQRIAELDGAIQGRSNEVQTAVSAEIDEFNQKIRLGMQENMAELDQTRLAQKRLGAELSDLNASIDRFQAETVARITKLRGQAETENKSLSDAFRADLTATRDEFAAQLEEHIRLIGGRIQTAGKEMGEQAQQVTSDLEHWQDAIQRQVEELRGLAQGLHQDTLGGIQSSITAVQKQAQDLYNRINTEIAQSLVQHEETIMGLTSSTESDIRRLQNLSAETQTRIIGWQETLGKTETELARDIQELRENAKTIALKGTDDMRAQLAKRQDEVAQVLNESITKLKSDIAHSRGDIEQDVGFLQQQIDQWKAGFQDHLKILQENSKNIEEQALDGLKDRIETLREDARQLTRKVQEEFEASFGQQQAQIQAQMEGYNADIRKVQVINKDLQSAIADLELEIAQGQAKVRDDLEEGRAEAQRMAATVKDSVQKEIEERHKALLGQVKTVLEQMGVDVSGSKTNIERELALMQQQIEQSRVDLTERMKSLQQEGTTLRRDAMAGFQERVDALRDEARKLTGNVKTEITQLLAEHQGEVQKQLQETEGEFHRIQDMSATSQLRFQEIQDIFNKAESMSQKEFETLRDKSQKLAESTRIQLQADLQKQRDEAMALVRQNVDTLTQEVAQTRRSMQAEMGGLSTEFEHYGADLRERFAALSKQGMVLQEQTVKLFQADLDKIRAQSDGIANTVQEQTSKGLELHRQQIAQLLAQSTDDVSKVRATQNEVQSQVSGIQDELARRIAGLETDITRFSKELADRVQRTTEDQHNAVMVDVERRIKDYEKEIAYRIEKIETVNSDIDNLESNLRQSMERLTGRLKTDIEKLGQEFHQRRAEDIQVARKDMDGISLQMVAVEKDLDELKKRAYDNVSEKLKVFEDDFFVDLSERSERMDQRISEWKEHVQGLLVSLEESAKTERDQLEERFALSLRERMNEMATRLGSQFEKVEENFEGFQASLNNRIGQAQQGIEAVETELKDELKGMQTAALDGLQKEFVRMNQDVDSRIRAYERDVESRLQKTDQELKGKTSDLQALLETSRSDMTIWQNQVLQQMKGTESAIHQDLAGFRTKATETITEIKDEFSRQRDDLIADATGERAALKQEIQGMSERIARMQADLEYKTRETLETFTRDYAGFQADFQRQNRDVQEELEDRMKDFRAFVGDARQEFEGMQRRLFSKLDDDSKSLDLEIREIDKRIKAFVSQTKLFDRADALQASLGEKIEQMKIEIQSVDEQRKTILDLDPYLAKVRKMAEEANEKITKLNQEKKRLDGLDDDYKKLMSISSVVDQKLAQVTASNDTLTEIQLSLRHLEEVQKDVEAKFGRLEKKSDVLDATTDGIEKNFQLLNDIEQKVSGVRTTMQELPRQVQELGERVNSLLTHKKDADAALKNVTNLDKILKDVEVRITELNKSRDWIARTETRFSEITREADEKVNLLATLVKKDIGSGLSAENGSNAAALAGGPAPSVREVVLKLAQQGWRVEEIARTTKLSRGEVELILEMGSRN